AALILAIAAVVEVGVVAGGATDCVAARCCVAEGTRVGTRDIACVVGGVVGGVVARTDGWAVARIAAGIAVQSLAVVAQRAAVMVALVGRGHVDVLIARAGFLNVGVDAQYFSAPLCCSACGTDCANPQDPPLITRMNDAPAPAPPEAI
ncbi:hypothetical protein BCV70DRAFT_208709, partial [Testicularia cyperi]